MGEIRLFVLCIVALILCVTTSATAESISITTDNNTVYSGDTIILSGSNVTSDHVYLFITGPNLPSNGGYLNDPRMPVINGQENSFVSTDILEDTTWEYWWSTAYLGIDPGSYTVYAAETPNDIDHLGDTNYSIQSFVILADNRIYPQMPDTTAGEDPSTDERPPTAIPGDDIAINSSANNGIAFLGDEIAFSGSNLNSDTVYLFITGPNLPPDGGYLNDPRIPVVDGQTASFVSTNVLGNNTWEYKWQTAGLNIDPSTYTIYAVATPSDKSNLTTTQYATKSVSIRKPFLNATLSGDMITAGESLFITGVAEGNPSPGIAIWIFGQNKILYTTESVNPDGTFSHEVTEATTQSLANGEYSVVVQHPMHNDVFDVFPGAGADAGYVERCFPINPSRLFKLDGPSPLPSASGFAALLHDLNDPNIDDRYTRLKFVVGEPSSPPLTGDYLSATVQQSAIVQGENISITGSAKGSPAPGVAIWMLGNNTVMYDIVQVDTDSDFEYKVPTNTLPDGNYSIVVQHPMYNGVFDVWPGAAADEGYVLGSYPVPPSRLFNMQELRGVSPSLALAALVNDLNNPNIDDVYTQLKIVVGEASPSPLEDGYLLVHVQPSTIAPGEKIRITGSARGNPTFGVAIWIFGKNTITFNVVSVNADATFTYEIPASMTKDLANGEYSVVVQHPMYNDAFDVLPGAGGPDEDYVMGSFPVMPSRLFKMQGAGSLFSSSALQALVNDLNNPNIDDRARQLKFVVRNTTPSPPEANFTITDVSHATFTYSDISTGIITSRIWDFGDGTFAENVTQVNHTYIIPGNYTVMLTVSNNAGSSTMSNKITVHGSGEPTQTFIINATPGVNGEISPSGLIEVDKGDDITFTISPDPGHLSCFGGGTRYVIWNITVDGQTVSREGEPSLLPVNYSFTNVSANHTISANFTDMIIDARPMAAFNASPRSGFVPLPVHFSQVRVSNNTGLLWSFGDNSMSFDQNPDHTYSAPGNYTVSLTVFCDDDSFTDEQPGFIQVKRSPPIGGDKGYFLVHSNVEEAQVFFNDDFKGNITNGMLNVSVYITATPYRTFTIKAKGYTDYTVNITQYPHKGETIDLYSNLIPSGFFFFNFNFVSFPSYGIPFPEFKEFNFSFFQF